MSTRLEIIKRYLAEEPNDSFLRYAMCLEYMSLEKNDEAYSELEKLLNDDPDYLAAYYMAGKTAEATGKNHEALKWYSKGILVAKNQKDDHTRNELNAALDNVDV